MFRKRSNEEDLHLLLSIMVALLQKWCDPEMILNTAQTIGYLRIAAIPARCSIR